MVISVTGKTVNIALISVTEKTGKHCLKNGNVSDVKKTGKHCLKNGNVSDWKVQLTMP